jgi:hypothetical protein
MSGYTGNRYNSVQHYLENKTKRLSNGCIQWTGYLRKGYGAEPCSKWFKAYKVNGAHQLVWVLNKGNYDRKLVVRHLCNNKGCVNIKHLALGTQKQNIQDAYYNKNNSWLDTAIVLDITKLGVSKACVKYPHLSYNVIRNILAGKTYTIHTKGLDTLADKRRKRNIEIKRLRTEGKKLTELAFLFNLDKTCISKICSKDLT